MLTSLFQFLNFARREISPYIQWRLLVAAAVSGIAPPLAFIPQWLRFMSEEIFDVVNERDEVIDRKPRSFVHANGLLHRAVHVLVFNSRGEIFLQKRSLLKDRQPGVWDSSASGHVDSGETYDETAVRELREEIGLDLAIRASHPLEKLFKIDACAETDAEFVWVYRCENDGPFQLHPDEIERGDWFAPELVTKWISEKPQEFATAFVLIWELFAAETRSGRKK